MVGYTLKQILLGRTHAKAAPNSLTNTHNPFIVSVTSEVSSTNIKQSTFHFHSCLESWQLTLFVFCLSLPSSITPSINTLNNERHLTQTYIHTKPLLHKHHFQHALLIPFTQFISNGFCMAYPSTLICLFQIHVPHI